MHLRWIKEQRPTWDDAKTHVFAGAPGLFAVAHDSRPGDLLPGEWWHVELAGTIVGYGWIEFNWAQGELLLAVDATVRGRGVGTFVLSHLHDEARARGLNYVYNVIPKAHPEPQRLVQWLKDRGYRISGDNELRANLSDKASALP